MLYFAIDPVQAQKIFQSGFDRGIQLALDPETRLRQAFPRLTPGSYRTIDGSNGRYNCIAWAVGKRDKHWWPGQPGKSYWPPGIRADATLTAVIELFRSFGYEMCDTPAFERRFEKVAIFVKNHEVTHAARQLWNGKWSSKLGPWELIEHELDAVAGHVAQEYGDIERFMRRKRTISRIFWESLYNYAAARLEEQEKKGARSD